MASGAADHAPAKSQSLVLSRLGSVLAELHPARWIQLVEDQTDKFANLLADLRQDFSADGDGKRIASGYAYVGMEAATAWFRASRDPLYPVMRRSIESFGSRWATVRSSLGAGPYHYVSLGIGDGQKDATILRDLRQHNPDLCYIPVDTSTDMVALAVDQQLTVQQALPNDHIMGVPLDFSVPDNVTQLRRALDRLVDDTPVLFSLLGNTLANIDDDTELLQLVTTELLRSQDLLLLEVATTPDLDQRLSNEAASEYKRSHSFGEFVTSALRRYTDLTVRNGSVRYLGSVEDDRALLIKMIYQNQTGEQLQVQLPEGDPVPFLPDDTIRLLVTRKYTKQAIDSMLDASSLAIVASEHVDTSMGKRPKFGMELMLVASQPEPAEPAEPAPKDGSPARDIWRR